MPVTETSFGVNRNHIHLEIILKHEDGREYSVDAILDTGAPVTEFSDQFLFFTGFTKSIESNIEIKSGLQSQKYNKINLPKVNICGHFLDNFEVFVFSFEESWGIDALIGLDFFRLFNVEIDYSQGKLITKQY